MRSVLKRMAGMGQPVRNAFLPLALTTAFIAMSGSALASVQITVDKNTQTMVVAVDGEPRYKWAVSTGVPAHETPGGSFKTFRMEADHYSKEWDDAPMPHAIFFTKQGHAIHGTDSLSRLGSPASHGCVRLSRANAATLFALVQRQGVLNTTVSLSGSSQVALARRQRGEQAIARNDAGAPVSLAPQRTDDGYVDATPMQRPTPSYRQVYGAQGGYRAQSNDWQMQQQQPSYRTQRGYYDDGAYAQRYYQPSYPSRRDYYGNSY